MTEMPDHDTASSELGNDSLKICATILEMLYAL